MRLTDSLIWLRLIETGPRFELSRGSQQLIRKFEALANQYTCKLVIRLVPYSTQSRKNLGRGAGLRSAQGITVRASSISGYCGGRRQLRRQKGCDCNRDDIRHECSFVYTVDVSVLVVQKIMKGA